MVAELAVVPAGLVVTMTVVVALVKVPIRPLEVMKFITVPTGIGLPMRSVAITVRSVEMLSMLKPSTAGELAERLLHDKWRASEIAEPVVHRLYLAFGSNLGVEPSLRVLKGAHWVAEDLRVGGRRARRKADVELFFQTMEAMEDR